MGKDKIKQAQKALDISEQFRDNFESIDATVKEYIETDIYSALRLSEKLTDLDRGKKFTGFANEFDSESSAKRVMSKINKAKRRMLFVKYTKAVIASASAVLAIVFMLRVVEKDRSQVVLNFTPQPVIPMEIIVPTLIDHLGNVSALEEESFNQSEDISFRKIDIDSKKLSYSKAEATNDSTIYNELIMPSKFIYTLALADGSEVIVNAGSKIKYPTQFNDSVRVVELSGEAYFNIEKSDKPFIVKTNGMEIRVYGTRFNINTYNNKTEAVLLSGSIGATVNDEEYMLTPNEMIVYNEDENVELSTVMAEDYIFWINSDFDYRKREMGDVLKDISRWYGIEITTEVDIDKINISLYSSRNRDVLSMLKLIEVSADVKFIREGGNIFRLVKEI